MSFIDKVKHKSGFSYRIRYRLNGKEYAEYLPLNTPLTSIRILKAEFDRRLALNKIGVPFVSPVKDPGHSPLLSQYFKWFLDTKQQAHGRGRPLHDRSRIAYKYAFKKLLLPLGDVKVSLTPDQMKAFQKSLSNYNLTTRSIIIRMLRAAWAFGIEENILDENPFRKVSVSKERKVPEVLTNSEMDRIFEKIENTEARIGFALARHAGLRRVEICRNVKWERVDFENRVLIIPEGKTGRDQQVPILPPLMEILKEYKRDHGYLVDLREDRLTKLFIEAKEKAGIKKPGAVRILRHSLGAGLLSQDVGIRTIQLLLRHSNITTTQIYTQIPAATIEKLLEGKKT